MAKKPETLFKERVLKFLDTVPKCWVLKTQELSRRGVPDILMCLEGTFVALELKTDGGKTDVLQHYELNQIRKAGGISATVSPKTFKSVFLQLGLIKERHTHD